MLSQMKLVFDEHMKGLKVDAKFIKAIKNFDVSFVTKNSDHINFFGSGLLGVYPIRWTSEETDSWLDDIVQVDELGLKDDLYSLTKMVKNKPVPVVDPAHKVSSDIVNLSMVYLLYRINTARELNSTQKKEGIESIVRIMHYKFLSSLMAHYFKFPADESVAKAAQLSLSNMFDIKQYKTWSGLINKRAEDFSKGTTIHKDTLKFPTDEGMIYLLSDVQTRIRAVVRAYTGVFYRVRENAGRVVVTSKLMEVEDGVAIRDTNRAFNQIHRYLLDILPIKSDFIRPELVELCSKLIPSMNPTYFGYVLEYLCDHHNDQRQKWIMEFVDDCILYTFGYINDNRLPTNDLGLISSKLTGMYVGSRVKDPRILKLRKNGDKLVKAALKRKAPPGPERTALLIYIALRGLTMHHFK